MPGNLINYYFTDKPIGYYETLQLEFKGKTLFIHCMKEEKFVYKFKSTFGTLDEVADHPTRRTMADGTVQSFNYPQPFSWHSKAKHWVDDHNQCRHGTIDLVEAWKIEWWPHRQFTFLLALSEVNAAASRGRAMDFVTEPVLTFCKKFALQMLENTIDNEG